MSYFAAEKNPKFYLLWPPCIADADIIFSFRGFFFFSRIISVVAEWMPTILLHMVWI